MPTIEVSAEVYKNLSSLAKPFEDREPNDVIARLIRERQPEQKGLGADDKRSDLISHVGTLPHGSRLRARYKGQEFFAQVDNGRIIWDGKAYESLSKAAVAVIQSTGTNRPTENGWRFWEVRDADGKRWRTAERFKNR